MPVRAILDGAIAGFIGALIVSLVFLFLDTVSRLPFYTPSVLGTGLFVGGDDLAAPDTAQASLKLTLMYTWVHWAVFMGLGMIVAPAVLVVKKGLTLGISILLLFVILETGFVAVWLILSKNVLDQVAWATVAIANGLAALGMAIYLSFRKQNLAE